jgi:hypothetical protein
MCLTVGDPRQALASYIEHKLRYKSKCGYLVSLPINAISPVVSYTGKNITAAYFLSARVS